MVGDGALAFARKREQYAAEIGPVRAQIRKREQWQKRGKQYLKRSKIPFDRDFDVRPDPSIVQNIIEQLDLVYPTTVRAMERHIVPVAEKAFAAWPVATGLSKSLIDVGWGQSEYELRSTVRCYAPYAAFIRPRKGAPTVWTALLYQPLQAAARRVASDIAKGVGQ